MNIRCHGCGRHFRVRQDRLPPQGARTRCPRCDEVLVISPPEEAAAPEPMVTAPAHDRDDLFELPSADLEAVAEGLFHMDGEAAGEGTGSPETVPPQAEFGEASRARGLRGWLARLFSRES